MHAAGRALAGQADPRDQDRRHGKVARRRAIAHRRHRRRLRRLSGDVRALRHRQLPLARRHGRDRAGVRGRPAAERPAHRLRHHLGRHGRSALRLRRDGRRGDAGFQRRHQGDADAASCRKASRRRIRSTSAFRRRWTSPPRSARSWRAIPSIDMVAWASPLPRKAGAWDDMSAFRRLLDATDKPVLAFGRMIHQVTRGSTSRRRRRRLSVPARPGADAARAQRAVVLWRTARPRAGRRAARAAERPDAGHARRDARALRHHAAAKPRGRERGRGSRRRAERIGFPVALKIRSADIVHKTEAGGVVLNLRRPAEVRAAAERLVASARKAHPNARIDGFLVQEMVSGVEAIVGARSDPLYGPMLLVGAGGILVELARRGAAAAAGRRDATCTAMIDGLKLDQAARRLPRPAAGRPQGARNDRAGAWPILSRSPREDRRHRDQSADGAPSKAQSPSTCACCGATIWEHE